MGAQIAMYFSWDRELETTAPLGVLENRFPALFEVRRLFWPTCEHLADPEQFDQGIEGFIQNLFLGNFAMFREIAQSLTGKPVRLAQRRTATSHTPLNADFLKDVDTLIIMSFDSWWTMQGASSAEIAAIAEFIDDPNHTLFVCPHHDIGHMVEATAEQALIQQQAEFRHHGDQAVPAQQRFGGFAISLLTGLGLPIRNRYGLRPARRPDGSPAAFKMVAGDRFGLLEGISALNLHAHLPHFERLEESRSKLEVLVKQPIEPKVPPHPLLPPGQYDFDSVLQATPVVARGALFVCDPTLWSSTAYGLNGLKQMWANVCVLQAPRILSRFRERGYSKTV